MLFLFFPLKRDGLGSILEGLPGAGCEVKHPGRSCSILRYSTKRWGQPQTTIDPLLSQSLLRPFSNFFLSLSVTDPVSIASCSSPWKRFRISVQCRLHSSISNQRIFPSCRWRWIRELLEYLAHHHRRAHHIRPAPSAVGHG